MSGLYTEEDAQIVSNYVPLGFSERDPYRNVVEAAHAILAVAAPLIAARALREFAETVHTQTPTQVVEDLLDRAYEIEAGE